MSYIYNSEQLKAWDAYTIQQESISSLDLMERASLACSKQLLGNFIFETVTIFCGKGNNGGDGLAIARILSLSGKKVAVYICGNSEKGSNDFEQNLTRLPKEVELIHLTEETALDFSGDLIVDALFGTGLNRPITNWISTIINTINTAEISVVSIDLPSGLLCDNNTTNPLNTIIKADYTFSFQVPKMAFLHKDYEIFTGKVKLIDIQLSPTFKGTPTANFIERDAIKLKVPSNFSYKGDRGFLTLIGGFENMVGAPVLSSKAAFRTGCGYVGVISDAKILTPLMTMLPEAIWTGGTDAEFPEKTTAIAIGPGLGQSDTAKNILMKALKANQPLVIDADALNIIARDTLFNELPEGSILTPHIGELNRLIGKQQSAEERLKQQLAFSIQYKVYIIQKGAYSKLTTPSGEIYVNSTGNAAMATAGMGDALTGMIGSFLAQGYSSFEAAKNGLFFHGLAGDYAKTELGMHGVITSDLIAFIPKALNSL